MKLNLTKAAEAEEAPSALNIAEARCDDTPLTTATFKHLRGNRVPVPNLIMPGGHILVLPSPDETARAVAFDAGFDLTEDELNSLREIEAFMQASVKASQPWALSNVSAIQQKQRDDMQAALSEGKDTTNMVIQSRDDINRACLARLNAHDSARRRKTTEELLPMVKPILERFQAALEEHMKLMEETDRAVCTAFSLAFEPSYLYRACFYIATLYRPSARLITSSWTTPGQLLGGLFS